MKTLFATDGRQPADEAARLLERVGDRDRVEVTVMSVNTFDLAVREGTSEGHFAPELAHEATMRTIDENVQRMRASGFRAAGRITEGDPGLEIVHAVEDQWYELILLGAGNTSWLGGLLFGSTSTYVLHHSPSSVLVVHESTDGSGRAKALFGADGSRGAEFALRTLVGFADPDLLEVHVLAVAKLPSALTLPVPGAGLEGLPVERRNEIEQDLVERARFSADRAVARLQDAGFVAYAATAVGDPATQLLKEAESGDYLLTALGSRGLGAYKRALLGSVSDKVARHSAATLVGRRVVI